TPPNNLTVLGGGAQSYGGTVTGNGTLTYAGTGTLALHGASTSYTGTLVVSSGTLAVSADFSAATAQVTGGTLAGTGFVKSNVGTSGAVNPGGAGAGGVLSTAGGAVASALGGLTYQADLSDAGPSDELTAGTGASLGLAGASLGVNVLSSSNGKVFTIVTSPSGGITGTFNGLPNNATLSAGGRTFRINYTANAVTLTDVLGPTTFHWT